MNVKLSSDDRQAVDLVLDRPVVHPAAGTISGGAHAFTKAAGGKLRQRIGRVEKVMGLLGEMPASDPPADLVDRTLQRIEREGALRPQPPPQIQAPAPSRPAADRPVQ